MEHILQNSNIKWTTSCNKSLSQSFWTTPTPSKTVFSTRLFVAPMGWGVLLRQAGLVWYRAGASSDGDQSVFRGEAKTRSRWEEMGDGKRFPRRCCIYTFMGGFTGDLQGYIRYIMWFMVFVKGKVRMKRLLLTCFLRFLRPLHVFRPWVDW